jgi:hypothetical protein
VVESRLNKDASSMLPRHSLRSLTLAAALASAAAWPAAAQGIPTTSRGFQPPVKQKSLPEYAPQVQPAALPGTLNLAAPAEKTQLDLAPTDALFDAINRGDIAAARDALNRGADIEGHNILGMSPLDVSVDLGRNDITFLLLSLRASGAKPATTAATASKPVTKTATKTTPVAVIKQVAAPQRFAVEDNGGAPNPQAGFLGFGGVQ